MGGERYNPFGNNQDLNGLFEPNEEQVVPPVIEKNEEIREEGPVESVAIQKEENTDTKNEKYKLYHSVKLTPEEEERFQQILTARGTNDSDVIKWCLEKAYSSNENDIKRIAKKRQRMETL